MLCDIFGEVNIDRLFNYFGINTCIFIYFITDSNNHELEEQKENFDISEFEINENNKKQIEKSLDIYNEVKYNKFMIQDEIMKVLNEKEKICERVVFLTTLSTLAGILI